MCLPPTPRSDGNRTVYKPFTPCVRTYGEGKGFVKYWPGFILSRGVTRSLKVTGGRFGKPWLWISLALPYNYSRVGPLTSTLLRNNTHTLFLSLSFSRFCLTIARTVSLSESLSLSTFNSLSPLFFLSTPFLCSPLFLCSSFWLSSNVSSLPSSLPVSYLVVNVPVPFPPSAF